MPLVRYEVRCEHRLANPELYRSAARDDPESLLEGVAMAGLVGIVRQLGDLAEFAAEIFCSLHDELMTLGARGHALHLRIQQLEDELPGVEKALLSEPNQLRFAYTNGADWHASIRSDQNHCTSDDLPRFVRNYYEECRGPPQLFLLDKFDVSGVGACLKRYTDPSFFKLEWASTELMKAQREQRDKRARRDKKKGRKRRTGEPTAAINQIPARVRYGSASLEDLEGLPHDIASALKFEVPGPSRLGSNRESDTQSPGSSSLDRQDILVEGPNSPAAKSIHVSAFSSTSFGVRHFKISVKDTRSANDSGDESIADEPEDKANTSSGRIARLIDHEDRVAAPAKGHIGALGLEGLESADGFQDASGNGHVHSLNYKPRKGTSRDDLGTAVLPRSVRTPVGTPRRVTSSEFAMEGKKAESLSPGKPPLGSDSPMLLRSFSRKSVYMDALDSGRLSGKFLWRNNMDGDEFSRQVSIARSGSEYDEFVDAPSRIVSEGESDFDSPGSIHKATHFNGDTLNHAGLKNHVEAQKGEIMSGVKLMEQQQNGRLGHDQDDAVHPDQVLEDDARYPDQVLEDVAVHPGQVLENAAVYPDQVLENVAAHSDQVLENVAAHSHQVLENDIVRPDHVLEDAAVHSDLQISSMAKPDIVSELEGPARHDESVPPPGTSSNADAIPSSPRCGTPQLSVFLKSTKSSLVSPRVVGSTGSSAPSSPVGSPKKSFQRIFLSSPSALSSPSPVRISSDDASLRHSLGNEESNPSSPSSSVIIKDSPPESARSSYTGSECESRDFDAILGRPATSGPASFPGHAEEESASKQVADFDEVASIASLRVISPKTVAPASLADFDEVASIASLRVTSPKTVAPASLADFDEVASIASLRVTSPKTVAQTSSDEVENVSLSPTSNSSKHTEMAAEISAKFSLNSFVSNSSADHSVSQERMAPSLQPQVDPTPTTLKPITTVRTTSKSYKSLTSNSPPDSPFGSDLGSNVNTQWRGKVVPPSTPPRTAFKLPHHPPFRSPVHTPRSFFSETGTLKWLGRLDPGLSPKPDFSLPPNLVCHSVSSSPVCSPPPQLDLDSPLKSDVVSEASEEDLGSPHSTTIILHSSGDESEEENHLTSPPASTSFSNVGIFPSLRLDTVESVSGDERHEPPMLEHRATSKSSASISSTSSLEGVSPPPAAVDVEEYFVLTRVAEIEQLAVSSEEALPIRPLRKSSSALDAAGASEAHHGAGVGVVDDASDQSVQESPSREAEGRPELETLSSADAKFQPLDDQEPSPSLLAEGPESTSDNDHCFGPFSPRDQVDSSRTLLDHIPETVHGRADLSTAAEKVLPSLSENELVIKPDVGPAISSEEASPSVPPKEEDSRTLDEAEPVCSKISNKADPTSEADVGAAHSDEEASPSVLLKEADSRILDEAKPVSSKISDKADSTSEADGGAAHSDEEASPSVPLKEAGSRILSESEPVNAISDLVGGARIQVEPPLESTSLKLTVSGPRSTDVTDNRRYSEAVQQSPDQKVEPSLLSPKLDNKEESAPLQTTKAKSTKVQSVEDASAPSESEFRTTPNTKAALEAAITRHDRNMLKELTFQEPVLRPRPSTDERSFFIDQIRTTSFNLRRTESGEKKDFVPRPVTNINVAAILEKANAIRQAFAGSDDEDGDDDWSDS